MSDLEKLDPWDWRPGWQRAVYHLRRGAGELAAEGFNRVWTELPGELAPQLAIAMAAEVLGDLERAAALYTRVIASDSTYVSAAFGLARCHKLMNQPTAAVETLNLVPSSSAAHYDAQVAAARALIAGDGSAGPSLDDLTNASEAIGRLQLDAAERAALSADVYERALAGLTSGQISPSNTHPLMGSKLTIRDLKRGLEQTYRTQARFASTVEKRSEFVDKANRARPRTLF